jgi:hypothetical protein
LTASRPPAAQLLNATAGINRREKEPSGTSRRGANHEKETLCLRSAITRTTGRQTVGHGMGMSMWWWWRLMVAAFHVQGNDVLAFDTKSGAQSRAPTPVSFRAGAGNINDNEDPELAQALQASMEGQWGPQETGVTGTHTSPVNPNFAPAPAGKHYDPNQWALMPAPRAETKEITRHPPPQLRKREDGAPAFLRNSLVSYTLSGLLTIMHAIPSAREAFLLRCYLQDDYGHHPKWWDGEKIQSTRIIEVEDERLRFAEAEEQLIELQRIMAFLDRTDRAYGCIDSLATMPRVQEQELTCMYHVIGPLRASADNFI